MDKRIQFQIQNLKSKLTTYQSKLTILENQRDSISLLPENNNTSNLDNTIPDHTIPDHTILEDRKKLLIQENNNIRSQIHNLKHEIALLNNQLSNYPNELARQLQNETTIYEEEMENIKNLIQENENQYLADLNTATLDKQTLADQIEQLKAEVANQQQKIQDIQIGEHQSRKDILAALHQKKRDKLAIQQQISQIHYTTNTFYQEHLNTISQNITTLQTIKTHIINQFYSGQPIDSIPESNPTGINLELLTPEYITIHGINPIIENIDTTLANLQAQHSMITNKAEKARLNGTIQVAAITQKHNLDNNLDNLDNLDNTSRNKDKHRLKGGYKGIYKMEKMRKMEMDANLEQLNHIYSNYTELIISEIEKNFISQNEYFKSCLSNATQRLEIMTSRINTNHITSTNNTNQDINKTTSEIESLSGKYMNNTAEITQIDNELADYNKNRLILEDLNKEIKKLKNLINQTQSDIEDLESRF